MRIIYHLKRKSNIPGKTNSLCGIPEAKDSKGIVKAKKEILLARDEVDEFKQAHHQSICMCVCMRHSYTCICT